LAAINNVVARRALALSDTIPNVRIGAKQLPNNRGLLRAKNALAMTDIYNQSPCAVFPVCFLPPFLMNGRDYTVKKAPAVCRLALFLGQQVD
jgi:hypothetical protein